MATSFFNDLIPCSQEVPVMRTKMPFRKTIMNSGVNYTFILTGMWYETTFQPRFGFDWVRNLTFKVYLDKENGKVKIFGDGNAKNTFSSIDDFAAIVPEILEHPKR